MDYFDLRIPWGGEKHKIQLFRLCQVATIVAIWEEASMARFVHVRDLKNQATRLLRDVEGGTTLIVTRRGKPVATVKPFEADDVRRKSTEYPTTLYDSWCERIAERYPELRGKSDSELKLMLERISAKVRRRLRFKSWREMDKAIKGDRFGLTR